MVQVAMTDFMDIEETAEFLRVRPATLYVWVHQRRIPYRKHGGRLVFYKPDLLDWSDKRLVRPVQMGRMPEAGSCARLKAIAEPKNLRGSLKTRALTAD